jgi:hypothetical protein
LYPDFVAEQGREESRPEIAETLQNPVTGGRIEPLAYMARVLQTMLIQKKINKMARRV